MEKQLNEGSLKPEERLQARPYYGLKNFNTPAVSIAEYGVLLCDLSEEDIRSECLEAITG